MVKRIALVSNNHEIIFGFRVLYASVCQVHIFTTVIDLRFFLAQHSPDYILVDCQFAQQLQHDTSLSAEPRRIFFITSTMHTAERLPDTALHVLSFPRDMPLLFQESVAEAFAPPPVSEADKPLEVLVGTSPAMQEVKRQIVLAAKSDVSVLITGETGTGKGLVARLIHQLSSRAHRPLKTLTMTTVPENLAESVLFGTVRGAFTDAVTREGIFESARGTTLFLDEIGDIKPEVQAKLLTVIEDGTFQNVGSQTEKQSDARLLFATNADLQARMLRGMFRSDLYYRMTQLVISLPPLRERNDDVVLIARQFLAARGKRLSHAAEMLLTTSDWRGNVRQLHNCMERAVLLCASDTVDVTHIVME